MNLLSSLVVLCNEIFYLGAAHPGTGDIFKDPLQRNFMKSINLISLNLSRKRYSLTSSLQYFCARGSLV